MIGPVRDIEAVSLGSLKRYLATSGWNRRTIETGIELFSLANDEEIEIILPPTAHSKDVKRRIFDAVTTLAALERRNLEEILISIRAISYDVLRSRLPDTAIRHDTLRLGDAEEFIKRMVKVLAATAHGELHTGPYFERISSVATAYANECRFGHTFRGSFGFTVESPVGPNTINAGEFVPASPLERRAMLRLARGLRVVEGAIKREAPSEIVENYENGLNANACEDLATMVEIPRVEEISFEIAFSPEWGLPDDLGAKLNMTIGHPRGLEVMREAAKQLRIVNYEKQRTVVGKVRTLHSMEDNPAELFTISGLQDVVIEWESEEFGRKLVRVSLGPEEYLQAMEAHRAGRTISVFGELERQPWRLENARDFRLV
ncbi:hypothetical protein [Bosea sp. ASV33]|uniref:hypothetical protein n=1 Tax=Bosea sp. ASV33 TaxID=2795106 RepID=UPI0018ED99C8|nr:hypothetical protein [Bosea sp. ASV33]